MASRLFLRVLFPGHLLAANIVGNGPESESRISIISALSTPSIVFVVSAPKNFLGPSTPGQFAEVPYNLRIRKQRHSPPVILRCGHPCLLNFQLIHCEQQRKFAQKSNPSLQNSAASPGPPRIRSSKQPARRGPALKPLSRYITAAPVPRGMRMPLRKSSRNSQGYPPIS